MLNVVKTVFSSRVMKCSSVSGDSELARRIVYQWDEGTDYCYLTYLCV